VDVAGSRALLTGASGGIGKAIARALHAGGAELVVSARREDVLEEIRAELGDRVEVAPGDLAVRGDVEALVERAGAVDVLVANAALPASGRIETFGPEEIDRALEVNLRAPVQLARALVPAMVERGRGHVVLVSSLSGKIAAGGGSIYSATKFGLRGFGTSLRDELRGSGVGVTVVFPGFISGEGMWAETGLKLPPGVGMKSPDDVARAVVRGIERDRAEIEVAPLALRASARLAGVAPETVNAIARRLGSADMATALSNRQRHKR
jgi:short-subunit dehydrogenase